MTDTTPWEDSPNAAGCLTCGWEGDTEELRDAASPVSLRCPECEDADVWRVIANG